MTTRRIPKVRGISRVPEIGSRTKSGRIRSKNQRRRTAIAETRHIKAHIKKAGLTGNKAKTGTNKKYTKGKLGSFPGKIKGSKDGRYPDGTPGRFVQEIRGTPGKHFIESGVTLGVDAYLGNEL